ncbi:uncharacterized protein si:ch211-67e16.4 isoform X5 [Gadus macrocephalus]|uniref:uncharacterized protein si:ch211-67e16.4 isoform X5 n=1 Tax=Gadus macrocephalus TaxID=80720 RepID=UPI0028CBB113|nr:uncharacterized protein si:ch211-67e16.4 isoform X5 [Gadus macrocephalus]
MRPQDREYAFKKLLSRVGLKGGCCIVYFRHRIVSNEILEENVYPESSNLTHFTRLIHFDSSHQAIGLTQRCVEHVFRLRSREGSWSGSNMDVSIAVSLIRGQMGTVVEQAVNGAVETVLAEMLRIVGVKFEELKAQVAALQRDKAAVQREKSLKEKENDKIRAMLRYTELKLKYYRQGVEEEIQQRATTSSHPSSQNGSPSSTARGLEPPPGETGPGSGLLDRTASENSQVIPASQSGSRPMVRVSHQSDEGSEDTELTNQTDQSDALPDGLLGYGGSGQEHGSEDLHYSGDEHASVHEKEEEEDGDWIISLQSGMQSAAPSAGHAPFPADSSTLPCSTPPVQVKEEFPTFQEVLSIKEEPEEEQVGTLLLDCQGRPAHLLGPEGQQSEFSGGSMMQRNLPGHMAHGFNFPGSTSYSVAGSSLPALLAHVPPRQAVRPWPKDLRLYEEYKLRRNELQRRSIDRRREREKSLPQPLLADLVRERREKTRLRVARWRAKRKLQAGLNQAQEELFPQSKPCPAKPPASFRAI